MQGLPAIGKEHVGIAWFVHHQVPVHRIVVGVLVVDDLKRPVLEAKCDVLFGEVIAQRGGALHPRSRRVIGRVPRRIITENFHLAVDVRGDAFGTRRVGKPVLQEAVHPVADAQPPRCLSVFRFDFGHPLKDTCEVPLLVAQEPRLRPDGRVLSPCRPGIVHQG